MADRETQFDELEESQKRGQATEALLKAELLVRDVPVLVPEYDNEPYDFVIEVDDEFFRIQAKTAYRNKPGTVQFETVSTRARAQGYDRQGYDGRADLFAVYNPVLDETYLVPVQDAPSGKMEIRYQEPENGQVIGVNWHEEFLLSTRLPELAR